MSTLGRFHVVLAATNRLVSLEESLIPILRQLAQVVLHHTAAKIYSFQPFVKCTTLIHTLYFYEGLPSDLQLPNFFSTILGLHGPPKMFDHD